MKLVNIFDPIFSKEGYDRPLRNKFKTWFWTKWHILLVKQ